jgi:DNA-binding Lrp family transcriptional regulator
LDALDTKIIREFIQDRSAFATSDIRKSYRSVARQLRVDEVTVRKRIAKMQRTGFLGRWNAITNPTLLGMRVAQLSLDVQSLPEKSNLIEELKLLPGALVIVNCFGSSLYYAFLYGNESDLQRKVELVQRMSKTTNLICTFPPIPECKSKLSKTDWAILKRLQSDAHKSYRSMGLELGVSTRTVKRRMQRLMQERAVFTLPSFNPNALEGLIQADLMVLYDGPKAKAKIDANVFSLWNDYLARAEVGSKDSSFFNLLVKNVSQAQEVLNWVKDQPGVKSSRVDLVQDRLELYSSLDVALQDKLEQLPAAFQK